MDVVREAAYSIAKRLASVIDQTKAIRAALYYEAKKRAKQSGLDFNIDKDDIIIPDVCPILGIPLQKHRVKFGYDSYSLDRVDSTKGYVKGNVRVISWHANNLKRALTIEQIERMLQYMRGEI